MSDGFDEALNAALAHPEPTDKAKGRAKDTQKAKSSIKKKDRAGVPRAEHPPKKKESEDAAPAFVLDEGKCEKVYGTIARYVEMFPQETAHVNVNDKMSLAELELALTGIQKRVGQKQEPSSVSLTRCRLAAFMPCFRWRLVRCRHPRIVRVEISRLALQEPFSPVVGVEVVQVEHVQVVVAQKGH